MLLRQLQHWTELGWRRRGGCGWCGGRSGREFRSQFPHLCGSPTYLSASICHAATLLTVAGRRRRWRRGSSRAVLRRLRAPGDDPRWFVRVPPSRSARRDVQFLVVSGRRRMRAGLVLLPLCHARLSRRWWFWLQPDDFGTACGGSFWPGRGGRSELNPAGRSRPSGRGGVRSEEVATSAHHPGQCFPWFGVGFVDGSMIALPITATISPAWSVALSRLVDTATRQALRRVRACQLGRDDTFDCRSQSCVFVKADAGKLHVQFEWRTEASWEQSSAPPPTRQVNFGGRRPERSPKRG